MRPKFLVVLFLLTGVVLAGVFYLKSHVAPVPTPPAIPEAAVAPAPEAPVMVATPPAPVVPVPVPVVALTPEQRQAAIDAEIERLRLAGLSDNPADLTVILTDLTNPEKEIREAAILATKQFGSTNAIPALQTAAENTTNATEKADLLEAADFIALPSTSISVATTPKTPEEVQAIQQQIVQREAARQAKLQNRLRASSHNSQAAPPPNPNPATPTGN